MEVIKKQRLAVCRILLDVVEGACEVRDPDLIMRLVIIRHFKGRCVLRIGIGKKREI